MKTKMITAFEARNWYYNADFSVDTALSWDGEFPELDAGDFVVVIDDDDAGGTIYVIVSRRYTCAIDFDNAASIALDAYLERSGSSAATIDFVAQVTP